MLIDIDSDRVITGGPYQADFDTEEAEKVLEHIAANLPEPVAA